MGVDAFWRFMNGIGISGVYVSVLFNILHFSLALVGWGCVKWKGGV